VAYGHAHRLASSEKQRHEMAADETGSTEHRDAAGHTFLLALHRHRRWPRDAINNQI
jgi:hypothetical protein